MNILDYNKPNNNSSGTGNIVATTNSASAYLTLENTNSIIKSKAISITDNLVGKQVEYDFYSLLGSNPTTNIFVKDIKFYGTNNNGKITYLSGSNKLSQILRLDSGYSEYSVSVLLEYNDADNKNEYTTISTTMQKILHDKPISLEKSQPTRAVTNLEEYVQILNKQIIGLQERIIDLEINVFIN